MASGIRCAGTTSASNDTPNSRKACPAAPITGQSESEPITIPTRGRGMGSGAMSSGPNPSDPISLGIGISHQVRRGMPRPLPSLFKIISGGRDMAHLAAGADLLAIQLHPQPPITSKAMQQRRRKIINPAAETVRHDPPGFLARRVAERQVEDGTQMVFELRGVGPIDRPMTGVVWTH